MTANEKIHCCVCYEELNSSVQPLSTNELLERLEESWNSHAVEDSSENNSESTPTTKETRRMVRICKTSPSLHVACDCCAFKLVKKYPRMNKCPLCKGNLSCEISLCQRLKSCENRVKKLLLQQKVTRKQLNDKVKRLCDEFGSRLTCTTYYVDTHPDPFTRTTLFTDTSSRADTSEKRAEEKGAATGVCVSWTRKQTGSRLSETLSFDVAKHDLLEESEWMRIIEHTCGIRLVSTAALSKKMFQDRCAELQTEIMLCTRAACPSLSISENWTAGDAYGETNTTTATNETLEENATSTVLPSFGSVETTENYHNFSSLSAPFRPASLSTV